MNRAVARTTEYSTSTAASQAREKFEEINRSIVNRCERGNGDFTRQFEVPGDFDRVAYANAFVQTFRDEYESVARGFVVEYSFVDQLLSITIKWKLP